MTIIYLLATVVAVMLTDALAASRAYRQKQQDHLYELMLTMVNVDRDNDRNISLFRHVLKKTSSRDFTDEDFQESFSEFQRRNNTMDEHINKMYTIIRLYHPDLSKHLSKILTLTAPSIPEEVYKNPQLSPEEQANLIIRELDGRDEAVLKDEIDILFNKAAAKNKALGKGYIHQISEKLRDGKRPDGD